MNSFDVHSSDETQKVSSLVGSSYTSETLFQLEKQTLLRYLPLYVCTAQTVSEPGQFAVCNVSTESVIVACDEDKQLNAFANVCRHRGTRLVDTRQLDTTVAKESKRLKCFTCPYHAWRYDLKGKLISARQEEQGNPAMQNMRLRALSVQESAGLVFYHGNPVHYPQIEQLDEVLGTLALESAVIGASKTYQIKANWKLWVENFLECWHCAPNHPELSSVKRFISQFESNDLPRYMQDDNSWRAHASSKGWTPPIDNEFSSTAQFFHFNVSMPLAEGKKSATKSGERLGPALGGNEGLQGGALFGALGPQLFYMAYVDYVVLFSVKPHTVGETVVDIHWLVAPEFSGDKEDLMWLWDTTVQQDIFLVEQTHLGVSSMHYMPGPFCADEYRTEAFTAWWNEWKQAHVQV